MRIRSSGPLPVEVDHLREAVQTWRTTRTQVGPMPVALWKRAVRLAATHGASRIARAVGVDYCALCERVDHQDANSPAAAFLEIPAAMVLAGGTADGTASVVEVGSTETLVDIALADGSQLRMRGQSLDAVGIVAAFMGRR